jgi:hypothetical protein
MPPNNQRLLSLLYSVSQPTTLNIVHRLPWQMKIPYFKCRTIMKTGPSHLCTHSKTNTKYTGNVCRSSEGT